MKNVLALFLIGVLLIQGVAAFGINNEHERALVCVSRTFTEPVIQETLLGDQRFVEIDMEGNLGRLHRVGEPLLPVYVERFELPFGSTICDATCDAAGVHSLSLSQKILPAPEPVFDDRAADPVFMMDEQVYQSEAWYPHEWYSISTGGGLNENHQRKTFVTVQMFPVRYHAIDNRVLSAEKITVMLQYQKPQEPLILADDEYDMVIIAPWRFSSALRPLIEHKNEVGVKTVLKTTNEIYREYEGVDQPEQIKYFIKDAIEQWNISYVLLVGGIKSYIYGIPRDDANQGSKNWFLPARYTNTVEPGTFNDPGFLSDLYYMDIYDGEGAFSSWDTDGDGIFARWNCQGGNKDDLDFYPDVYVGRLACRNIFEVFTVVHKIIHYESTPIDPSWYNRMVVVGGDSFNDSMFGTNWAEDELICDMLLSHMDDVEPVRLYATNKENDSVYTPLTTNILREINAGCGFLVFAGHGCPYEWFTNWHGEFESPIEDGGISIFDFFKLRNGDKLPICCIEGGCHNSMFNVSLLTTFLDKNNTHHLMTYGTPIPECLGWTFVRKPGGGAIANFGYPSSTYLSPGEFGDLDGDGINEPDIFEAWRPYMVRQYYKLIGEGVEFLGDVAGGAVREYLDVYTGMDSIYDAKIIEQVIFFGDPSLKIGGYS